MILPLSHPKSPVCRGGFYLPWYVIVAFFFGCVGLFLGFMVSENHSQRVKNVSVMIKVPDVPIDLQFVDLQVNIPLDLQLNKRQIWFLKELEKGKKLKAYHLTKHWGFSEITSRRDIKPLMKHNLIEYVGSPKTGYYRIKHKNG